MRQSLTAVQQFDVIGHHGYSNLDSDDNESAKPYRRRLVDWESDTDVSITSDVSCSTGDWADLRHFRYLLSAYCLSICICLSLCL